MRKRFRNKLMQRVVSILENHPNSRDSDERVVWHYITRYYGDPESISAGKLLAMMHSAEMPHFESITRARRKIQKEREDLRGETYAGRKKKEAEMKTIFGK